MSWKYKVLTMDHFLSSESGLTLEEELNRYGEQGWELVGVLEKPYDTLGTPPKIDGNSIVFKKEYK